MNNNTTKFAKLFATLALALFAQSPAQATIFNNTGVITIVDGAPASPYSSIINVTGMAGNVSNITVTLKNVSHDYVGDMSVILQAPSGQSLLLQSGFADGFSVSNITYTFSDAAASQVSATAAFGSGTYKPTGHFWDIWNAPAPPTPPGAGTYNIPGPFTAAYPLSTLASTFNGLAPNGQWKLWVADFSAGADPGVISGGWTLNITSSIVTPLELQDFNVATTGNNANLNWQTQKEENADKFDIERRLSGKEFEIVGSVKAYGNRTSISQYTYNDNFLTEGLYEYRLKMIDIDGQFSYSKIATANVKFEGNDILLSPNPVHEKATLSIQNTQAEAISIQVIDLNGKVVYTKRIETILGNQDINLPLQHLHNGLYALKIQGEFIQKTMLLNKL